MQGDERSCLSIILAAGSGTRMRSALPKVLHPVAGLPMLGHVLTAAREAGSDSIAVVVGHGADRVSPFATASPDVATFEQHDQLGTAHAVLAAREAIADGAEDLLVLFGDTPLLTAHTLAGARRTLATSGAAVVVCGFRTETPRGYGRLLVEDGELVAIREENDASEAERQVQLCNGGIMALAGAHALELLDAIGNDNSKGEFYLTDIVELARARSLKAAVQEADPDEVLGVNTRAQLADAERLWQERRRHELLSSGVSMVAPETVWLHHDTRIEADAHIEPCVVFGPGVVVAAGATIRAHSHIEGSVIRSAAVIGPFARLRPGTDVGERAKIGNFCEVKSVRLGDGAKVNHLTYVGDADVGAGANLGAGTITCNYDGVNKHRTTIGADAFIGSNSSLVAPVKIGSGAYIGSGSVVTRDVPADALMVARPAPKIREGFAKTLRARALAAKEKAARKVGS